jgi:hypothetical protein
VDTHRQQQEMLLEELPLGLTTQALKDWVSELQVELELDVGSR